jgi:hypothetical protein
VTNHEARAEMSGREFRLIAICGICHRWEEGAISTPMALQKIQEAIEPPVVRTGGQHVPDIQATNEPPARTPAAKAHREFQERTDGTSTPF